MGWLVVLAALLALVTLGLYLGRFESPTEGEAAGDGPYAALEPEREPSALTTVAGARPTDRPLPVDVEPVPSDPPMQGRIALVIDDLGRDLHSLQRLSELPVPVSYAVLPFESSTDEVVDWLARRGEEFLLHLPMQAEGTADPGPGALYTNLGARKIRERTRRAIAAVPGAVGVNNHMGSAFTADPTKMRTVLQEVADRGLFFLDSRTSGESVGYELAGQLGIPRAERAVFLDNQPSHEAISRQFDELLQAAKTGGSAIAIGHPYVETLDVLAQRVPEAVTMGFEFVPVSFLLERSTSPRE